MDLHSENKVFEEICYWIENKHVVHITPENIVREWERNKLKKSLDIINQINSIAKNALAPFKGDTVLSTTYQPNIVHEIITQRIGRIDLILKTHSEIAKETEPIYREATKRNLDCLAPNHSKDSFRDTINILTLLTHIENNRYLECFFSTSNFSDFSVGKARKHDLHPHLEEKFKTAKLQYVYFDEEHPIGHKLLNVFLRPALPSFQQFILERTDAEKKADSSTNIENANLDYLENIKHIDIALSKKDPTAFEQKIIKSLIESDDSYKKYFFKNLGSNGLV